MYFWKTKKLLTDIKNNAISEEDKLKYFIIWLVLSFIVIELVSLIPSNYSVNTRFLILFSEIVIIVVGVYAINSINKEIDNQKLIERIIMIGLPVTIKLFVISIPIFIIYGIILGLTDPDALVNADPLRDYVFTILYQVIYFFWIWSSFKYLKENA